MKPTHLAALLAVTAAACGRDPPSAQPIAHASLAAAAVESPAELLQRSPATRLAAAKRKSIAWTVSFQGAGPLQPGMSLAKAVIATEGDFWTRDGSLSCSYFQAARAPGMKFLFLHRYLARIEVDSGTVATPEGVKIGATEEQVQAAYPGQVTVSADTYSEGHFLSVRAPGEADSALRIVFETDGKRVTRYRTGVRPAVEWVEGCS